MSKGKYVLYLDDITSFSKVQPMFGFDVAESLNDSIAEGNIQVVTAASADNYQETDLVERAA